MANVLSFFKPVMLRVDMMRFWEETSSGAIKTAEADSMFISTPFRPHFRHHHPAMPP
jgi:hypothetical protein